METLKRVEAKRNIGKERMLYLKLSYMLFYIKIHISLIFDCDLVYFEWV